MKKIKRRLKGKKKKKAVSVCGIYIYLYHSFQSLLEKKKEKKIYRISRVKHVSKFVNI